MKQSILALALALGMMPLAALAQQTNAPTQQTDAPAPPTDAQRQAMRQAMQQFVQQEEQLHQQMRSQILSALSPVHRRAVAATIGNLAVAENPDLQAAARQLDQTLTPAEQQRILAAHETFKNQSMQLHEQMRAAMQSEMPAGHPMMAGTHPMNMHPPTDAGSILLMALAPHPLMDMMMHPGVGPAGPPLQ